MCGLARWCFPLIESFRPPLFKKIATVLGAASLIAMGAKLRGETDPVQGRVITCRAVALNPTTHKLYAVDEAAGTVSVIDEKTGSGRKVKVGERPIAIAINSKTNRIYVANTGSGSISVIDGARDAVVATVNGEKQPYVLAVNDVTNKIYVTNTYSDMVTVIDGATNSARALKAGSADGIAIDRRKDKIFLMTYEDPNLRVIDGATDAIRKVNVGTHLWGMIFDPSTDTLYLGHTGTANLVEMNENTHAVHTIPVGEIPNAVGVNPAMHRIYVVNYGDQTVSVIDSDKGKVIATLPVGEHPQAIAVDTEHNRIYVANLHGDSVTVIDGVTNTVMGTLRAGKNPYALVVDTTTGNLYAANYGEPSFTSIDVAHASPAK
ncbi:MAG: YncE family protein [Acidobacteriota bacterium]